MFFFMAPIFCRLIHYLVLISAFGIGFAQAETVFQDGFETSTACVLNPNPADANFFGEFCVGSGELRVMHATFHVAGLGRVGRIPLEPLRGPGASGPSTEQLLLEPVR